MITDLQFAVRDFVREKMLADPQLAAGFIEASELVEGEAPDEGVVLYEVRAVLQEDVEPEDRSVIYVMVSNGANSLTTLKDCMIEVSVGSAMDLPEVTVASHAALEQAVERCWDKKKHPTAAADLSDHIEIHLPDWTGGDYFAEGWQESREGEMVIPAYTVKAGVRRVLN